MRTNSKLVLIVAALTLAACNKSSPPPQQPVKPRGIAMEMPVQLPAP